MPASPSAAGFPAKAHARHLVWPRAAASSPAANECLPGAWVRSAARHLRHLVPRCPRCGRGDRGRGKRARRMLSRSSHPMVATLQQRLSPPFLMPCRILHSMASFPRRFFSCFPRQRVSGSPWTSRMRHVKVKLSLALLACWLDRGRKQRQPRRTCVGPSQVAHLLQLILGHHVYPRLVGQALGQ